MVCSHGSQLMAQGLPGSNNYSEGIKKQPYLSNIKKKIGEQIDQGLKKSKFNFFHYKVLGNWLGQGPIFGNQFSDFTHFIKILQYEWLSVMTSITIYDNELDGPPPFQQRGTVCQSLSSLPLTVQSGNHYKYSGHDSLNK